MEICIESWCNAAYLSHTTDFRFDRTGNRIVEHIVVVHIYIVKHKQKVNRKKIAICLRFQFQKSISWQKKRFRMLNHRVYLWQLTLYIITISKIFDSIICHIFVRFFSICHSEIEATKRKRNIKIFIIYKFIIRANQLERDFVINIIINYVLYIHDSTLDSKTVR